MHFLETQLSGAELAAKPERYIGGSAVTIDSLLVVHTDDTTLILAPPRLSAPSGCSAPRATPPVVPTHFL